MVIDFDRKTIHIWRAISRDEHEAIILSQARQRSEFVRSARPKWSEAFHRHGIEQRRRRLEVGEIWSNPTGLVFTSGTVSGGTVIGTALRN